MHQQTRAVGACSWCFHLFLIAPTELANIVTGTETHGHGGSRLAISQGTISKPRRSQAWSLRLKGILFCHNRKPQAPKLEIHFCDTTLAPHPLGGHGPVLISFRIFETTRLPSHRRLQMRGGQRTTTKQKGKASTRNTPTRPRMKPSDVQTTLEARKIPLRGLREVSIHQESLSHIDWLSLPSYKYQ